MQGMHGTVTVASPSDVWNARQGFDYLLSRKNPLFHPDSFQHSKIQISDKKGVVSATDECIVVVFGRQCNEEVKSRDPVTTASLRCMIGKRRPPLEGFNTSVAISHHSQPVSFASISQGVLFRDESSTFGLRALCTRAGRRPVYKLSFPKIHHPV